MTDGMEEPDPDLELVVALQGGDDSALNGLMERHQEALFRFIHRHVLIQADAVELTQEAFVRVYFNVAKFRPDAKFSTWLYRIALNLCRDYAKSRRYRELAVTDSLSPPENDAEEADHDLPSSARTPAEDAQAGEKLAALERGIAQLPHDLRSALVLTVFEQRSQQESAELLKTTPKTVETRVYRARQFLRSWLSKAGF
jgi:RNA polymerase sigma-70 factor (ECF subfamily)